MPLRLYFKDATEIKEIKAGTPYIVKWNKPSGYDDHESDYDISNRVFQNVKIDNSDDALKRQTVVSADEHVQFIGTYSPVAIYSADHDNLFLGTGNKLHYPQTDGYTINACRAYFHVDLSKGTNVRAFSLHFDDDGTTGIVDNKRETITNNRWYTLDGRRLNSKPTTKGLYIYNGNKMVVK